MSVVARSIPAPLAPADVGPAAAARPTSGLRPLLFVLLPLAAVYLAMLNPYWVPSGDGDVYTCIARSLVKGEGLMFNGSKAAIAPPGWPLVLSLAMRVSPQFLFLKLVTTTCMLAAFVPAFYIVRRFVTDRMAVGVMLLTGTLSSLYPLTFWMHTEAFFCLLSFAALLLAFRIREGRAAAFEAPLMLVLLTMATFTRWPGVLNLVLVVPILLSGPKPAGPVRWAARYGLSLLVAAVLFGTWGATYRYLSLTPQERQFAKASGGTAESDAGDPVDTPPAVTTQPTTTQPAVGSDAATPGAGDMIGDGKRGAVAEVAYRIVTAGRWFAWLLWQPTRFGQSINAIDLSGLAAGWLAIALLALTMVAALRRREFFWLGLALYTGGLCVGWPNPNARYFIPVAPFIVVGVLRGIREWSDVLRRRRAASPSASAAPGITSTAPPVALDYASAGVTMRAPERQSFSLSIRRGSTLHPFCRVLVVAFVCATLATNLPLLAIDISVFRSRDFYGRYEAGANKDLIAVAQYLRDNPRDGRIAINEIYDNMGRARYSKFGMRALHLLTDQPIIGIERRKKYKGRPNDDDDVRRWLKRDTTNAVYCVFQAPWSPWRVWHFRFSPAWQARLTGKPATTQPTGGWELYGRRNANYPKVDAIPAVDGPRRVPGL